MKLNHFLNIEKMHKWFVLAFGIFVSFRSLATFVCIYYSFDCVLWQSKENSNLFHNMFFWRWSRFRTWTEQLLLLLKMWTKEIEESFHAKKKSWMESNDFEWPWLVENIINRISIDNLLNVLALFLQLSNQNPINRIEIIIISRLYNRCHEIEIE